MFLPFSDKIRDKSTGLFVNKKGKIVRSNGASWNRIADVLKHVREKNFNHWRDSVRYQEIDYEIIKFDLVEGEQDISIDYVFRKCFWNSFKDAPKGSLKIFIDEDYKLNRG